jgi:hypothetical protein
MELDSIFELSMEVLDLKKCVRIKIERFKNWKN